MQQKYINYVYYFLFSLCSLLETALPKRVIKIKKNKKDKVGNSLDKIGQLTILLEGVI